MDPRRQGRLALALGLLGLLAFPAVFTLATTGGVYTLLVARAGTVTAANVVLLMFLAGPLAALGGGGLLVTGRSGGAYLRVGGLLGLVALALLAGAGAGGAAWDVLGRIALATIWAPAALYLGLRRGE